MNFPLALLVSFAVMHVAMVYGDEPKSNNVDRVDICFQFHDQEGVAPQRPVPGVFAWLDLSLNKDIDVTKFDSSEKSSMTLNVKQGAFDPRLFCVRVEDSILVQKGTGCSVSTLADYAIGQGEAGMIVARTKETIVPKHFLCDRHPEQDGYALFLTHRCGGVTDVDGKVVLEGVPKGARAFRLWHEKVGWIKEVTTDEKIRILTKGEARFEIARSQTIDCGISLRRQPMTTK